MPSNSEPGFGHQQPGPTPGAPDQRSSGGQESAPAEAGSDRPGDAIDRAFAWLRRHQRAVLAAAVLFQAGVLLSLSFQGARPLYAAEARTVLLQVYPVDPRDLMRGDYVTLGYDFSRTSVSVEPGTTVYAPLVLDPDGRHARGPGLQAGPPPSGTLYLRGTAVGPVGGRFGIEKFFVPEGQGKPYEEAVRTRQLWAEVTIAPDGEARLQRLVIE